MAACLKLFLLALLVARLCHANHSNTSDQWRFVALIHKRCPLIALVCSGSTAPVNLPNSIIVQPTQSRCRWRRGRRGGIRQWLQLHSHRPPLPAMILSNIRALKWRSYAIKAGSATRTRSRHYCAYWDLASQGYCQLSGQGERCKQNSSCGKKSRGWNLFICEWQEVLTVHSNSHLDIELRWLSLRPFYLPQEFRNIILCAAYVPPSAKATRAAGYITEYIHDWLQCTWGALVFILGDFNDCKLELALLGYEQNVKESRSRLRPPITNSDHNTVYLIPIY